MKKYGCMVVTVLLGALLLTGCAGDAAHDVATVETNDIGGYEAAYTSDLAADYDGYESDGGGSEADIVKSNMKIVRDADVSVDVENLETFDDNIRTKVSEFGGYFEEASINDYSDSWSTDRYGNYKIRIPADKLDAFLSYADGVGSITNKTITSEDVSLQYVDIEAHLNALKTERDKLETLLEQSENVSDIIEVQDRLTSVQAQLDSYESQLRTLSGRISYSTVSLSAREEREVEHPIRQRLSFSFGETLMDAAETTLSVVSWFIVAIPSILIIICMAAVLLWIARKVFGKVFARFPWKGRYAGVAEALNNIAKALESKDVTVKEKNVDEKD